VRYRVDVPAKLSLALGVALALGCAVPAIAYAEKDSGGAQLPKSAPPVTKAGEEAKGILAKIEADTASLAIVKDTVDKGEKALARAQGAKLSGDEDGARLLSDLALELAKTAEAVVRAVAAEKKANESETRAATTSEELKRTKTLLAETQAHAGQVAAELAKAKEGAKGKSNDAAKKEEDRQKKDAKKPKKSSVDAPNGASKQAKADAAAPPADASRKPALRTESKQ
jgi:hypothetical protein